MRDEDRHWISWGAADVVSALRLLRARFAWILISNVVFVSVFGAYAVLATPVYRATVVAIPSGMDRSGVGGALGMALGSLGGLASLAGVSVPSGDASADEALAVLDSRDFTRKFIDRHDLMPILFSRKWDAAKKNWAVDQSRQPTPAQAYDLFDNRIRRVAQDRKSGLITLQIDWRNRNQAAEWANGLISQLNSEMRSRAIDQASASIGFLERELDKTSVVATRDAISRLIEVQVRQRMLASVSPEYSFRVLDPATPPDLDDVVSPRKLLLLAVGIFVGSSVGIVAGLLAGVPVQRRGVVSGI